MARKYITTDPLDRLVAKVSFGAPTECWEWNACKDNKGYGRISGGKSMPGPKVWFAHRLSYALTVGDLPAHMDLDHLCRNHGCVNPDHLEIVTRRENTLRGTAPPATNARKSSCHKGHPYDERNTHFTAKGYRSCRECHRLCEQQRRDRVRREQD